MRLLTRVGLPGDRAFLVASVPDRVVVLHAGRIREEATTGDLLLPSSNLNVASLNEIAMAARYNRTAAGTLVTGGTGDDDAVCQQGLQH